MRRAQAKPSRPLCQWRLHVFKAISPPSKSSNGGYPTKAVIYRRSTAPYRACPGPGIPIDIASYRPQLVHGFRGDNQCVCRAQETVAYVLVGSPGVREI
ncbi:hypothetical protein N7493_011447 [Penicillium malachiteum]|uniref:Uncharacterized protein n=1 Tax=Penicillium malachiteum TaxID=1324776 RepID=A0AAD6HCA7_9EURO|nr:hypothetical protein N7493_011447 [Penicillium malachiteum]